jgi:2-desacetyl-2-hydroxyethyl bacteriochlorophyllide A dehydrogenase
VRKIVLEFVAKGRLEIQDLGEPPDLQSSQVLLETQYTGVTNGTERHALLCEHGFGGGRFPSRHGYQHVATVGAVGEGVTKFKAGDWVFYGAYVGHRGWNVVDENDLLIKLPESVDRRYCALLGVAGVALRGVRRMGVRQGDNVWVVGQGPIGNFTAQAAKAAGAKVTVTDMIQERLDAARACGAHIVLSAADANTNQLVKQGAPYSHIYDCCSAPALLADIHNNDLLAFGGTVGMMAVRDTVTYPWSLLHVRQARIETSCHFDKDDLRVLLFLHEQGLVSIEPMVSHFVSITEAPMIYDLLAKKAHNLLGVIFDWTQEA